METLAAVLAVSSIPVIIFGGGYLLIGLIVAWAQTLLNNARIRRRNRDILARQAERFYNGDH